MNLVNPLNPISDHPINRGLSYWGCVLPGNVWAGGLNFRDLTRRTDGTLENGTVFARAATHRGLYGALDCTAGTSSHVDLGAKAFIEATKPFTVSCVCYLNSFANAFPVCFSCDTDETQNWRFGFSNNGNYNDLFFGHQTTTYIRRTALLTGSITGTWRHITITFDGSDPDQSASWRAYENGISIALTTSSGFASDTGTTKIGNSAIGTTFNWEGLIGDVRVYSDRLLGPREVAELNRQSLLGNPDLLNFMRSPRVKVPVVAAADFPYRIYYGGGLSV